MRTALRGIQRPGMRRGSWMKGCLIAAAVVVVLIIAGVITLALTWKSITAGLVNSGTTAIVDQSSLPADQKTRIKNKIKSVTDDFKAGKIPTERFGHVMEAVAQSPLIPLAVMAGAEAKYFPKSGLTAEEKAQAKTEVDRFAHGVASEKLNLDDLRAALAYISKPSSGNNFELKDSVTDDELRKFITELKTKADKAEVPASVPELNIADEVEKAIDKGLAAK